MSNDNILDMLQEFQTYLFMDFVIESGTRFVDVTHYKRVTRIWRDEGGGGGGLSSGGKYKLLGAPGACSLRKMKKIPLLLHLGMSRLCSVLATLSNFYFPGQRLSNFWPS